MKDHHRMRGWSNRWGKYVSDPYQWFASHQSDDKNMVFEQCTGLKDKNGNLIYEGDIFSALNYNGDPNGRRNYRVEIMKGCYYGWPLFETEYAEYEPVSDFCSIEIIGNIHENPEFLK